MRLIHARTLQLKEFVDETHAPPYAILSHTWEAEEVSFQQLQLLPKGHWKLKKIESTCRQALQDDLSYIWVDTCCIDKASSSELSEAINSMFRWYEHADVCYAYLADVQSDAGSLEFAKSRWFKRGWTLQELLAPPRLIFFNASWTFIGNRSWLSTAIAAITEIDTFYTEDPGLNAVSRIDSIRSAPIAKRMSWASQRVTTRVEDMAYCLLGIFDVNMPMLYGEGRRAFLRLQEEILKQSVDMTIFAFGYRRAQFRPDSKDAMLADSPKEFAECGHMQLLESRLVAHYTMSNLGLHISLPVLTDAEGNASYALLDGVGNEECCLTIPINRTLQDDLFRRTREYVPILVSRQLLQKTAMKTIYIAKRFDKTPRRTTPLIHIRTFSVVEDFRVASVHPPNAMWHKLETQMSFIMSATVVAVHFASIKQKLKFKIMLHRPDLAKQDNTEFSLSNMDEHSALESMMLGLKPTGNKIAGESVGPMALHLRCQFSHTCKYAITVKASALINNILYIRVEESLPELNDEMIEMCDMHIKR